MKKLLMFVFCGVSILNIVGCSNKKNNNILKLNHNVDLVELEPSKIIQEKQENLAVGNLPEVERKMYEKESYLDSIITYIKNNFNVDIDSRWEYVIHYYNDELDKNTPFYNQIDESLEEFAKWNPDFDSER